LGWGNFRRIWGSEYIGLAFFNSLLFVALAVPLRVGSAFFFALLLRHRARFFGVYRTAVYLPTIIPEAAYALIWLWIFNPVYGPLNLMLGWLGVPAPVWLADPLWARLAMVILSVFQMGEGFVILLVGLQTVPANLYEAAGIDGATQGQKFRWITLPLLTPWLLVLVFRDLLASLQNTFAPSYILTYGGPYYATTFVPLVVYEVAFDFFDFGTAAAVLVVTYLFIGGVIGVILWGTGLIGGGDDV